MWHRCFDVLQVNIVLPPDDETFTDWWLKQRGRFSKKILRGFDSYVIGTAWSLWKQRDTRVFNKPQQQRTPSQLVEMVLGDIKEWKLAGLGVGGLDPFVRE